MDERFHPYHSENMCQHVARAVWTHFSAEFAQHANVNREIERRKQHRSWLLHSHQAKEWPFAIKLRDGPAPLKEGENSAPHAPVLALISAAPLEKPVENGLSVKLDRLLLYFQAIWREEIASDGKQTIKCELTCGTICPFAVLPAIVKKLRAVAVGSVTSRYQGPQEQENCT